MHTSPNNSDKPKPKPPSKSWIDSLDLLTGTLMSFLLVICVIILFTLFGDYFDFTNKPTAINSSKNYTASNTPDDDWDKVENGIHVQSGLIYDPNFDIIRANCTTCHSGKLIAQNRATREGWQQMIRWMQATQGLWDLGENEPIILDYLEKNYAPEEVGRRANIDLAAVEWYILDLESD